VRQAYQTLRFITMNVSGPAPIVSVNQPDEGEVLVRLNQRLTAEVLQVTGDRVVLAVNGVQVVARMTSMEQAAELIERRMAQFIVKDLSSSNIILQLVPKTPDGSHTLSAFLSELLPQLLTNAGLPVTQETTQIAQSLLQAGLPVTPELVNNLQKVLSQITEWGQPQADILAVLIAYGLPVSPQVLTLINDSWPSLSEMISHLSDELKKLRKSSLSASTVDILEQSLSLLGKMVVDMGADHATLAGRLQAAIQLLGTSIENHLYQLRKLGLQDYQLSKKNENLLTLVLLRQALEDAGLKYLSSEIDSFLDAIRQMQYLNSDPEIMPVKERWLKIELPLSVPENPTKVPRKAKSNLVNTRIQIAYLPDEERFIDTKHTRCVIRVELALDDIVQVDTTIADQRVGIQVATSTEELMRKAQVELSGLKSGLEALGLVVQSSQCRVEDFSTKDALAKNPAWSRFFEVRVEV
jgi:hypothetical protein